jgi:NAD(P)-dependent dehydrogenase (short-subunit alcohol dehydrogenase family)
MVREERKVAIITGASQGIGGGLVRAYRVTQLAAAEMLAKRSGHIVNISATLADQPRASVPAALASLTKGGLSAMTSGLAIEFAKQGVRVNAVAPGIIDTPMHKPETHDFLAKLHPMGRVGTIEDIANAVLFLESSPFITGEIIHVDGGWHAGQG